MRQINDEKRAAGQGTKKERQRQRAERVRRSLAELAKDAPGAGPASWSGRRPRR
jgi:hypothetical protein